MAYLPSRRSAAHADLDLCNPPTGVYLQAFGNRLLTSSPNLSMSAPYDQPFVELLQFDTDVLAFSEKPRVTRAPDLNAANPIAGSRGLWMRN